VQPRRERGRGTPGTARKYLFRMLMAGGKKRQERKTRVLRTMRVRRVEAAGGMSGKRRDDTSGVV
jgi:hypothetical protein